MKTTRIVAGLFTGSALICSAGVSAQDAPPPPSFVAIEAYLCVYRDDKGPDELMKVTDKWNKWMDKHSPTAYSAWVMHPVFSSVNMPIDVVWLGAWQNGNDMGRSLQDWADKGRDLMQEFNAVVDCGEHSNAASVNIRPPAEGWPGEQGLAAFSNCTIAEDKTISDAMAVHRAWADHLDTIGSKAGMWAFFPGAGQNNPEWDYKIVMSYPDYVSYGADWENFTNGQGWEKAMELGLGSAVSCDSSRVYDSVTVRNAGIDPMPE